MLIAFHKPYGVLSQFTPEEGSRWDTLASFDFPARVYPIGRLDADSEGLLLLSDEARWNQLLLHPKRQHLRRYWAQVERIPSPESLRRLQAGVVIQAKQTLPCTAFLLGSAPSLPDRIPPIRFRLEIPTAWIELVLVEGKNRQVRRMTAAIGHPTLRLIRVGIGAFELGDLELGQWKRLTEAESVLACASLSRK